MHKFLILIILLIGISCNNKLDNGIYINSKGLLLGVKNNILYFYNTSELNTFTIYENKNICCLELVNLDCYTKSSSDSVSFEIGIISNQEFNFTIYDTCITKNSKLIDNKFIKINFKLIPWDSLVVSFLSALNADTIILKKNIYYNIEDNSLLSLEEEIQFILNGNLDDFYSIHGGLQPFILKIYHNDSLIYNRGIKNLPAELFHLDKLIYAKIGGGRIFRY
ncbi:MAG: hypothetical protein V9E90_12570 [Saprospiraceae bacterium]|jgi:hypothetical protein